ncbi:MAG TPA: TrbG/VirB9 family P-type conjugative transfer protein [Thermoanaerobaculia bacterium]|nr:TrbG/VirB9 family P-type conjugative transfer protein [Thermoanaerobaculia bacterium]
MRPYHWYCVSLVLLLLILAPAAAGGEPGPAAAEEAATPPDQLERLLAEVERASQALDAAGPLAVPSGAAPGPEAGGLPFPTEPGAAAWAEALEEYAETGEPPVLGLPTRRVYPFGHQVPVLRCLPLRACDLVFEEGERLAGWALGDTERWLLAELTEGGGETAVAHLLVKPTDFDLATNLVVVTDRRTYHLELASPAPEEVHGEDGDESRPTDYDGQLAWWYPDDFVRQARRLDDEAERRAAAAVRRHEGAVALDVPLDPERLSFAWEVRRPWRPSRRLGWRPVTVFDDGRRVYLRLPAAARSAELPVVLGKLEDGEVYPLDARVEGDWWIVPSRPERIELVVGSGKARRSLTLVREGG